MRFIRSAIWTVFVYLETALILYLVTWSPLLTVLGATLAIGIIPALSTKSLPLRIALLAVLVLPTYRLLANELLFVPIPNLISVVILVVLMGIIFAGVKIGDQISKRRAIAHWPVIGMLSALTLALIAFNGWYLNGFYVRSQAKLLLASTKPQGNSLFDIRAITTFCHSLGIYDSHETADILSEALVTRVTSGERGAAIDVLLQRATAAMERERSSGLFGDSACSVDYAQYLLGKSTIDQIIHSSSAQCLKRPLHWPWEFLFVDALLKQGKTEQAILLSDKLESARDKLQAKLQILKYGLEHNASELRAAVFDRSIALLSDPNDRLADEAGRFINVLVAHSRLDLVQRILDTFNDRGFSSSDLAEALAKYSTKLSSIDRPKAISILHFALKSECINTWMAYHGPVYRAHREQMAALKLDVDEQRELDSICTSWRSLLVS